MKLVIIESPYKGKNQTALELNKIYLRSCIRDCINRGESPYASHRMLTDALDDDNPLERSIGIRAGLAWKQTWYQDERGDLRRVLPVFYVDLQWSDGMNLAKECYNEERVLYEERKLPADDPFFK